MVRAHALICVIFARAAFVWRPATVNAAIGTLNQIAL